MIRFLFPNLLQDPAHDLDAIFYLLLLVLQPLIRNRVHAILPHREQEPILAQLFLCQLVYLWPLRHDVLRFVDRNAELPPALRVFQARVLVEVYGGSLGVDGVQRVQVGVGELVFLAVLLEEVLLLNGDAAN